MIKELLEKLTCKHEWGEGKAYSIHNVFANICGCTHGDGNRTQWFRKDVCKKCGKPREKVLQDTGDRIQQGGYGSKTADHIKASPTSSLRTKSVKVKIENGYTDCGCGAGFEPGIVLDPFFGSGTTGLTALKLGRDFIGIEQNDEYIKLAEKRLASELEQERLAI